MADRMIVTLVCTGAERGQRGRGHPVVQLGQVAIISSDDLLRVLVRGWPREPGLWLDDVPGHSGPPRRLQARCPRCGRNPPIADGHAFVAALGKAGMTQVDICRLPF